jgi:hypothetical protein
MLTASLLAANGKVAASSDKNQANRLHAKNYFSG